jgi:hypothetical protein
MVVINNEKGAQDDTVALLSVASNGAQATALVWLLWLLGCLLDFRT